MYYRIDGGIHRPSVAALSPLNARKQIENGSIHADLHDVLCTKLHIHCFIFETEDTITQGVCFLRSKAWWVHLLRGIFVFGLIRFTLVNYRLVNKSHMDSSTLFAKQFWQLAVLLKL